MFSSDCEAVSVASDNPNMYHRSISMVSDFQMVSNVINDTDLLLEKYFNGINDSFNDIDLLLEKYSNVIYDSCNDTDLLLEKYLGWG